MFLALDTSTRYAGVALANENQVIASHSWHSTYNHTTELIPTVIHILERAGVTSADLDGIVVALGPGGFSALRVGMSLAKSISYSRDLPLVCIPTLDIEAEPYLGLSESIVAVIPAGKSRKYIGKYQTGTSPEYMTVDNENVFNEIPQSSIVCGEGAYELQGSFNSVPNQEIILKGCPPPTRQPSIIAMLGYDRLSTGNVADKYAAEPIYLRSTQLENAQRSTKR